MKNLLKSENYQTNESQEDHYYAFKRSNDLGLTVLFRSSLGKTQDHFNNFTLKPALQMTLISREKVITS